MLHILIEGSMDLVNDSCQIYGTQEMFCEKLFERFSFYKI